MRLRRFDIGIWTALVWVIIATCILLATLLAHHEHTVTHSYYDAAKAWFQGRDVYHLTDAAGQPSIHGFLYLPTTAVLYGALAALPFLWHEVIWRLLEIGAFAYAIARLCRMLSGVCATHGVAPLLAAVLAMLPAVACMRNGQMNLMIAVCLTLGIVALAEEGWWRATLWLALGVALKPPMLVPALLAAALYRQMRWRLLLGLSIALLLPFAAQSPSFVLRQYHLFAQKTALSSRPGEAGGFADLFSLLRYAGLTLTEHTQTCLRLAAALGTLLCCLRAARCWPRAETAFVVLILSSVYMMLFNPRTELNTYLIPGVPVAVLAAVWLYAAPRDPTGWAMATLIAGWMASWDLAQRETWLSPLLIIGLAIWIATCIISKRTLWPYRSRHFRNLTPLESSSAHTARREVISNP
ncbi:MAG: glycosyltransferase family 87 protein [bacterium]